MTVGTEWLIDADGCAPSSLRDLPAMRALLDRIVHELDLRVLGDGVWHQFPSPGGVTGLYLLTESHLACHTYPERGSATFNLYCCRARSEWRWAEELRRALGATRVTVRVQQRCLQPEPIVAPRDRIERERP